MNWGKLRHGRRLERRRILSRHAKLKRAVKEGEKMKMSLHPEARGAWEQFLEVDD